VTTVLGTGEATFTLDEGEMEVGIGIHGEQGVHRGPLETADEITDRFLAELGTELPLTAGSRVAVLVNGLGSTPLEELYVVYRRVHTELEARGVTIARRYVGEYVRSLEMAGASLSIMSLDDELEELVHAPASSPFFRQGSVEPASAATEWSNAASMSTVGEASVVRTGQPSRLRATLLASLPSMQAHTAELRELDAALGDGDLGITVGAGSAAVIEALENLPEDADAVSVVRSAATAFAAANPSTFAALVGSGLLGGAEILQPGAELDAAQVAPFLSAAFDRISQRGGAELGDKTLLDVLHPVIEAIGGATDAGTRLQRSRAAAKDAVASSAQLQSARGRAAWQGERTIGQKDPGGVAVLRFIEALRL
jgi:dihydroxyacetone kinase